MFGRGNDDGNLIYADPTAEEKPITPRRRGLIALTAALAALALVGGAVSALVFTSQGKGQRYQAALGLLEQKEYEAAAAELADLGSFRDSAELLARLEAQASDYDNALALLEAQRYEEAAARFAALEDYADSAQWVRWGVAYRQAEDLMVRAEAAEAQLAARAVPEELETITQDWEEAAALWESLETVAEVPDAANRAEECWTCAAVLVLNHGDPGDALRYMDKLSEAGAEILYNQYLQAAGGA